MLCEEGGGLQKGGLLPSCVARSGLRTREVIPSVLHPYLQRTRPGSIELFDRFTP
jgi:hypothetical protein